MTENNNVIKVEVVPGVEAEITDIDKATKAASEESMKAEIEAAPNHIREEDVAIPMGTTSLATVATGNVPASTEEEITSAVEENNKPFQIRAKEKLEDELKKAKDKSFAEPVIGYLLKRCAEDKGLAEDVCQKHKTWEKCFNFIYESARKSAKGNSGCAVRDDVVYEWAEDYYHMDDKAKEAEERKKKAAEQKKKAEMQKKVNEKKEEKPASEKKVQKKEKKTEEKPQQKKKSNELEGQMSLFSMMGL